MDTAKATFHAACLALIGVSGLGSTPLFAQVVEHRSAIFVLVDLSQTWHNKENFSRNERVLQRVSQGVVELAARVDRPAYISFVGIATRSASQTPICEATYHSQLLQKKGTLLQKPRELASFLEACSKAALSRPIAQWTDITGALDYVSRQVSDGQDQVARYAIVISDMKEERDSKALREPDLKRFNMLLAYRVLLEDDRDMGRLERRLKDWEHRLKTNGARVSKIMDTGLVAEAVARMVQPNGQR